MNTDIIKYSVKNLYKRKSRSTLTILSIFIGIATIFIFISFGLGLYNYVNTLAGESGADKFIVMVKGAAAPGLDNTFKLEDKDLDTVKKTKGVKEVAGFYISAFQIESENELKYVYGMAYSATPQVTRLLMEVGQMKLDKGRDLKESDSRKVVLGYNYQLPNKIFEKPLSLGNKIIVNGQKFEIIGFFKAVGNPQDDSNVYMTKNDIKELFPNKTLSYAEFIGRVSNKDTIHAVVDDVKKNLRKERGQEEGKEDFFVQTFDDLIKQFQTALNVVIGFVFLIALISVIVSAVNTANTMVTSVLERTKEIGAMKAIGARNSTIRNIFLLESSILGFVAGVLGVILGAALSSLAGLALKTLGWGFLSPQFSWQLFAALVLFATVVGTLSGLTTAIQASLQNPVDSLRYE